MKRLLTMSLVLLLALCLAACTEAEAPNFETMETQRYILLPDYDTMVLDAAEVERRLEAELSDICAGFSRVYHESGTVIDGDDLILDYQFTLVGESTPYDEVMSGARVMLGQNELGVTGFDEAMVGQTVGETFTTLALAFPEDYFDVALRGKTARFTVTVRGLFRAGTPAEPDMYMVRDLTAGELSDVAAYKALLRTYHAENVAFSQILAAAEVKKLPESAKQYYFELYYGKIKEMYQQTATELYLLGIPDFESYLTSERLILNLQLDREPFADADAFEDFAREQSEKELVHDMVLAAVGHAEGVVLTDERFAAGEAELIAQHGFVDRTELYENYTEAEMRKMFWFSEIFTCIGTLLPTA